jgi:hypothetical protein
MISGLRFPADPPANATADPERLTCRNCGTTYSASEARVQRRLKQLAGSSRGKNTAETPILCWVCSRLYHSSQQIWEAGEIKWMS